MPKAVYYGVLNTLFGKKGIETSEVSYEGIIEGGWDKRLSILNEVTE
jgi:hypothetical protein